MAFDKNKKDHSFLGYETPVDIDNESLIISTAIADPVIRKTIFNKTSYEQFRSPECRTIFWALQDIENKKLDVNIDILLLQSNYCPSRTVLTFEGIDKITRNFPPTTIANIDNHIEKLADDYAKSKILSEAVNNVVKVCMDPSKKIIDVQESVNYMNRTLEAVRSATVCEFQSLSQLTPQFLSEKDKGTSKRTTGFRELDYVLTDGFKEKTVSVITALSGMGKSSLVLSMIKNLSHKRQPTGLFALEMNSMAVFTKFMAYNTGLPVSSVVKPYDKMTQVEQELYSYQIERMIMNETVFINDKPQMLKNIEQQTMMLQDLLRTNYIPIFIDLFGKIKDLRGSDNFARDYENQLNEVQDMAKRLDTPLILVAQINRAVMQRKNKRPTMQDLKNAGAFEEVADLILGVHRPNYDPENAMKDDMAYVDYWSETGGNEDEFQVHSRSNSAVHDPAQDIAEVIVLKQRNGQANRIVNFYFNPKNTCYEPISREHQQLINQTKDMGEGGF